MTTYNDIGKQTHNAVLNLVACMLKRQQFGNSLQRLLVFLTKNGVQHKSHLLHSSDNIHPVDQKFIVFVTNLMYT